LRAALAAKRAEKQEIEAREQLEREKMRRFTGKEITAAKELAKEQEMKRALEQKKREKEEERIARQKIKEQIEADKKARREKVYTIRYRIYLIFALLDGTGESTSLRRRYTC
jgi:hypothetical protein